MKGCLKGGMLRVRGALSQIGRLFKQPGGEIRLWARLAGGVLLYLALVVAGSMLFGLAITAILNFFGVTSRNLTLQPVWLQVLSIQYGSWLSLFQQVMACLSAFLGFKWLLKRPFLKSLQLRGHGLEGAVGLLTGLLIPVLMFCLFRAMDAVRLGWPVSSARFTPYLLLYALCMAAVAFGEEALLRGYLMNAFKGTRLRVGGLLLSALATVLLHGLGSGLSPLGYGNLFLLGLLLGYLYLRTGSVLPGAGISAGFRFMTYGVLGFYGNAITPVSAMLEAYPVSREILTGGELGAENGLMMTVFLIAALALTCLWANRRYADYDFFDS